MSARLGRAVSGMLRQAVALARSGKEDGEGPTLGILPRNSIWACPVLIPADYIEDLTVRLAIYRRIAGLADEEGALLLR